MPLGKEAGLGPGHIVLDGDPMGTQRPAQQPLPTFRPMSIVAKRSPISATAELLLHSSPQNVTILYNGVPLPPSKLSLPMEGSGPHLKHFAWTHPSPQCKHHLDWLSRCCRAQYCDRQTGRLTMPSVKEFPFTLGVVGRYTSLMYIDFIVVFSHTRILLCCGVPKFVQPFCVVI